MSARPPPIGLATSAWRPHIQAFVRAVLGSVPPGASVSLSSWYRAPLSNAQAGGSPESQHLFGIGADLTGSRAVLSDIALRARRLGLTAVVEGSHLHLQLYPAGALARAGVRFPSVRIA